MCRNVPNGLFILKIYDYLIDRFGNFGKAPLCNLNQEHGICINGFYLPLCARCTGILIGVLLGVLIFFFILIKRKYNHYIHISLSFLMIPCIIDGVLQYFFGIESNIFRRLGTGLLCGISITLLISYFLKINNKNNIRHDR